MNGRDRTTATAAAGWHTAAEDRCRVVRAGAGYEGRQGLSYSARISAESAGARGLCLHTLVIPPGGRARAHLHAQHESAIYVASGESEMWWGDGLAHHDVRVGFTLPRLGPPLVTPVARTHARIMVDLLNRVDHELLPGRDPVTAATLT